jgi:glycosyltransferase involved in cell wall biosynthesis
MKIALVAQHTTPLGGPQSWQDPERARLRELAGSLGAEGHCVTLYAQQTDPALPGRAELLAGVQVEHIGAIANGGGAREGTANGAASGGAAGGIAGDRADDRDLLAGIGAFSAALRDRLRQERPDVVHAVRWTSGLAALAAARELGLPVVQSFQSLGVAERRHRLIPPDSETERLRLEPAIARHAAAVLAASTDEEADLARLGVPRRRITVVPDGVDITEFAPDGPVAGRNGKPRLVTMADAAPDHDLDTLLRALEKVPGAELIVAGGPPDGDGGRAAALVKSLGIADRVVFTGQLTRDDLPPLLRSADLYVTARAYEASAMGSLQAMACGTPVVAAAVGGPVDAVVDGTTGALVPPGKPVPLAQRIRRFLSHPMLLEGCSVAAADRARSRFSWQRIGLETLAVYDEALDVAKAAA